MASETDVPRRKPPVSINCDPLPEGELAAMRTALEAASLPSGDLELPGRRLFRFSTASGALVGFGGLEPLGNEALLRSMVVLPPWRGRGVGSAMLDHLMDRAHDFGIRSVFLLTEKARGFFERHGFALIERTNAPPSVLSTTQATEICPMSAHLLVRRIDRP